MMPGSKVQIHGMFTCQWMKDFMTRPDMRKKWGRGPMNSEYRVGLWGAERLWRSFSTDRSEAETAQHGTIRMALFDPNIMFYLRINNSLP